MTVIGVHDDSDRDTISIGTTGGAIVTVNVALQVVTFGGQVLVTVQVTVLLPPHAAGAVPPSLLMDELHPPVNVVVANHAAYAAFMAA